MFGAILHSSHELDELTQRLCHDSSDMIACLGVITNLLFITMSLSSLPA